MWPYAAVWAPAPRAHELADVAQVAFDATKFGRHMADETIEAGIDEAWKAAKRANPRLYNGE